jgi:short subunit dehydrogenase-like uncharacterized protein
MSTPTTGAARWMIYGANGYTGRIAAERAREVGLLPVLAGRRLDAVRPLAERLGCEAAAFSLDDAAATARALDGVTAVLHCAGPFSATSRPMVDACLAARAHYLDITGEVAVFEAIFARDAEARAAGVSLLPGVGFDVVPTDCVAKTLAERLPGATRLELAFASLGGSISPGTMKTMVENLGEGGLVRRGGQLVAVPPAHASRDVPFADHPRRCVALPWGDVSTAFRSTGIPDITVYAALPGPARLAMRLAGAFAGLAARPSVQSLLKRQIERRVHGPTDEQRRTGRSQVWGEVTAGDGRRLQATLEAPEGYRFTALAAVEAVRRLLDGGVAAGALTPSLAFGAGFAATIPGTALRVG